MEKKKQYYYYIKEPFGLPFELTGKDEFKPIKGKTKEAVQMNFEIKQIHNGIQHINRLTLNLDNGKTKHIDLWDNELKELEQQIKDYFVPVIE